MHSPERVRTALEHREPDRVPRFDFLYNHISLKRFIGERKITRPRIMKVWLDLGFDLVAVGFGGPKGYRPRRLPGGVFVNEWGVKSRYGPGMSWFLDGTIKDRESFDSFIFPDPHAEGRPDPVIWALRRYGERVAVAPPVGGAFTTSWSMMGFPTFVKAMHRDPALVRRLVTGVNEYGIELGKIGIDLGAELLWISDDFGGSCGPMVSPHQFREFLLPPLRKMVRTFRRRGALVLLHCDGNIMPIIDDIVGTGIDALHPIERKAGMDLGKMKALHGDRITLIGNLEASHLIPWGSYPDIDRQIRECFELGAPGGGYVFASDHSIHPAIEAERARFVFERAERYGRQCP